MSGTRAASNFSLAPFAACCSLLLASLANFLVSNDYPLLRPEVLIAVLLFAALSAVAALIYLVLPGWGRSLLEGLFAALFVELNTTSLPLAIAAGAAVAGFTLWTRNSLTKPMALFGTIVLVTTLLGLGGRTPWIHSIKGKAAGAAPRPTDPRPAIVHMILDEQIGIEGLPQTDPDAVLLSGQLKSFYLGAGFATYGGAYSENMRTMNAIPQVLNFGERLGEGMHGRKAVIGPTKQLERLVDQGYRLTILQTDYAEFCDGARFFECVTYEVSSPSALVRSPLSIFDRTGLLVAKFLSLSRLVELLLSPWRFVAAHSHLPKLDPGNLGRSTTAPSLTMFDELARRLSNARPGEAYFAHLLLPHYPYAMDENCRLLPWRKWKRPYGKQDISVRQHAYYAQDRCTIRKIAAALQALDRSPAGKKAIVIIHGDHGSRISQFDPTPDNLGKLSDGDMIALYSTNFAVRSPAIRPGYSSERIPIHVLLKDLAVSGFTKAPAPAGRQPLTVHLDGPDKSPGRLVPLPRSWTSR
jgi:hypothetical protein